MKTYATLLFTILCFANIYCFGQFNIRGQINDTTKRPIADVSLKLMRDTNVLTTTFSDMNGKFIFNAVNPGQYTIVASFIGREEIRTSLKVYGDTTISLYLQKSTDVILKGVTITANKPLLERKIDRIVFNVSNSIAAKGTDLTQALALTPMLRVDGSGISISGKSGVSIMINERIVNIGGADLVNYLKSLRSDDVEKIEVLTTPPAKYEAQGNSGMINIVLKSNPNLGWSGDISATYAQTTYPANANSLNINFQSKKFAISGKLRQNYRKTRPTEEFDVIGENSILSSDKRKDIQRGAGLNLSMDYKATDKANFGLIYDIGKTSYKMQIENSSVYKTAQNIDSILNTYSNHFNPSLSQTLNVYYDQKLGKKGKKLSSGFNYFSTRPETTVDFSTFSNRNGIDEQVRNTSALNYNIWSAQSDLTLPYKWASMEAGVKFTNFVNDSDVGYFNLLNDSFVLDPTKANIFEYTEQNFAAYYSMQSDFGKKWSAKAGLRYEYSTVNGNSPTTGDETKRNYGRLFPSLYLSYKLNQNNTLSATYSKRINRPNFRALNPFRWYTNPYTYSTGNPTLQPSYNHNSEVSYLYKDMFSLTLYMQKLVDGYGRIVTVNEALKVVDYRNYLTQYSSGLEATFAVKFFPWWENREFVSLNFVKAKSSIADVLLEDGAAVYYNIFNSLKINRTFSATANFWHSLPATQGNVYSEGRSFLSAGLRVSLLDGKLQLNASAEDILKGTVSRGKVYYSTFIQNYNNYYDSRRFSLTASYSFGKAKVKGNRKQITFKETQRVN
ncbi:outer membrane beta-barrel family protein [Pedobacter sp. ISL-64]|uniref:outer membrane beta-barrel family protein n=1 Tax=Pedobacter sp. ISL-64 TaxID=2819164 RepID=UPI001BEC92A6|nr:outer membrane beta-barrel family protein [Pedobacter sp. ISL-64]MBT2562528.1 TonB-dependent receptor family protein [Pedobacter sp. ISL-64]